MKRLKILPGAASIIALTATIGFVDGSRDAEVEKLARGRIMLVSATSNKAIGDKAAGGPPGHASDSPVYLVEIKRGDNLVAVKVDAVTGKILPS